MRTRSLLAGAVVLLIGAATSPTQGQTAAPRVERGQLGRGDDTLDSGEFVDRYTFQGVPRQRVTGGSIGPFDVLFRPTPSPRR